MKRMSADIVSSTWTDTGVKVNAQNLEEYGLRTLYSTPLISFLEHCRFINSEVAKANNRPESEPRDESFIATRTLKNGNVTVTISDQENQVNYVIASCRPSVYYRWIASEYEKIELLIEEIRHRRQPNAQE